MQTALESEFKVKTEALMMHKKLQLMQLTLDLHMSMLLQEVEKLNCYQEVSASS